MSTRLAVFVASTREGRFGPTVASWFVPLAQAFPDVEVDVVDLAEVGPGTGFTARMGAADAFVVITPEYNHSFPGPLKIALDSVRAEWGAKPVGFVSYGGISGGLRAVEALRLVFAELHAVTIRETVSLAMAWAQLDGDGRHRDPAAAEEAVDKLLQQLVWFASALREARANSPYPH